jgi:hypothetical protein
LCAWLIWGVDWNQPTDSSPTKKELPPRVFRPGEWTDMLDREPVVVVWQRGSPNSWSDFNPERRTLNVSSQDLGMVRLGEVNAVKYDMEVTFSQTPWTGGVGVFFRERDEPPVGNVSHFADYLLLERINENTKAGAAILTRGEMKRYTTSSQPVIVAPALQSSASFPRPAGAAHSLSITVGAAGLERVAWDDKPVVEPIWEPPAGAKLRAGASGSVGILLRYGGALISSVRVRVHSP